MLWQCSLYLSETASLINVKSMACVADYMGYLISVGSFWDDPWFDPRLKINSRVFVIGNNWASRKCKRSLVMMCGLCFALVLIYMCYQIILMLYKFLTKNQPSFGN